MHLLASGRAVAAIAAAFVLSASGTPALGADTSSAGDEPLATARTGRGGVFGRFVVTESGKEADLGFFAGDLKVRLRSFKTEEIEAISVRGDGSFYWTLKPGDYVIQALLFREHTVRLWSSFTVPEPGKAAYLGDLSVMFDRGNFRFALADRYDERLKQAAGKAEPVKDLMRAEERPGAPYRTVLPVCSTYWGLDCDKTHQGVVPVAPAGADEGYPVTSSLTPLLEWRPAKLEGVTYEVAVYEAFLLPGYIDMPKAQRDRGKLLFFKDGLTEPRCQLETPLPAGKKYMWSVRMRGGETVSTWSTWSYFVFLVVTSRSGYGVWFGFETPSKQSDPAGNS